MAHLLVLLCDGTRLLAECFDSSDYGCFGYYSDP
jgi:hypothetical protein